MATHIQFNLSGQPEADLSARAGARGASLSAIVREDWLDLYRMLRNQTPTLSEPEGGLLMDVLNSTHLDWSTAQLLWASVDDAREDDIEARHPSVDVPALIVRLRRLSQLQSFALVRAVALAWDYTSGPEGLSASDALRRVGLVA